MFKNIVWEMAGKFGSQLISFVLSVILTRLLAPDQFGVMGLAMVVISFAWVFLDLGFSSAIIQQQEITEEQLSTIFYLIAAISLGLTGMCFFLAAPLARFYGQPLIRPVFQALSLTFLLNGLNLVPGALLYKRMAFRTNSLLLLSASLAAGLAGIGMAVSGYGIWSLVGQSLVSGFLMLVLTAAVAGWRPIAAFRFSAIRPMWRYGSRLFASGMIEALFTRLDVFVVGKLFRPTILGFYTRAQGMDGLVRQYSAQIVAGTLFPYIARRQDDRPYLRTLYLRYLHMILFVSVGISGLLFLTAHPLFILLFTDRWLYAAELFRLMMIGGFAGPVLALMGQFVSGVGNSGGYFRMSLIRKLIFLPVYLLGFLWGLKGFILCSVGGLCLSVLVYGRFTARELSVSWPAQLRVVAMYLCAGTAAAAVAHLTLNGFAHPNPASALGSYLGLFATGYLVLCFLLRLPGVQVIRISIRKLRLTFLGQG